MVDPQSLVVADPKPKVPQGKSKFERIPAGPLQEVLKFLPSRELCRVMQTSKRMYWVANHDFMFRYLTLHSLPFFSKKWTENWKQCYARNFLTNKHFTRDKFNYEMCPIRHFKTPIVALDCYFNFVVAADKPGICRIFLIDEEDVANDEDTLQVKEIALGSECYFLKVLPDKEFDFKQEAKDGSGSMVKVLRFRLVAVTDAAVHVVRILQTSPRNFEIEGH